MDKPTPRRADAVENATRILEAAHELYDEVGLQAEIREISARAGVGVGTFYRNFPTKDHLTNALLLDLIDRWEHELASEDQLGNSLDALRNLIATRQALFDRHRWLIELELRPQVLQMETITRLTSMLDSHHVMVSRILQRAVDEGSVRADVDIPFLAELLVGASQPHLFRRLRSEKSVDQIIDEMLSIFMRGIGPSESQT